MSLSINNALRFALLLLAGFVLGVVAIAIAGATSAKNGLWNKVGVTPVSANGPMLADAQCTVPDKNTSKDVYFVSCGGFF